MGDVARAGAVMFGFCAAACLAGLVTLEPVMMNCGGVGMVIGLVVLSFASWKEI